MTDLQKIIKIISEISSKIRVWVFGEFPPKYLCKKIPTLNSNKTKNPSQLRWILHITLTTIKTKSNYIYENSLLSTYLILFLKINVPILLFSSYTIHTKNSVPAVSEIHLF